MTTMALPLVLTESEWLGRRSAHVTRMRRWLDPLRERRSRGERHPVLDFLFTYYSHRPSRLLRWHPGPGAALAGGAAREYLRWPAYTATDHGVTLDLAAMPAQRVATARFVGQLLSAIDSRPPHFGCFGLHEWAMVYQQPEEDLRHSGYPLRLGGRDTDEVVESMTVRCSHFDAYRFFTESARPRNTLRPRRDNQVEIEQPGCLHSTMDLFKWAYKLDPYAPSELIADCFELAHDVRVLDMRASPYDLSALGYSPVRIETAPGRAEYRRGQADFAERAKPLRTRLIELCQTLLVDKG